LVFLYKRIDLKSWVRSVVARIGVEFVGQESVKHCHVECLSSANHRRFCSQETEWVKRINKLAIDRNDVCVLFDFLKGGTTFNNKIMFQATFVISVSSGLVIES
jgi:hypothetical protein